MTGQQHISLYMHEVGNKGLSYTCTRAVGRSQVTGKMEVKVHVSAREVREANRLSWHVMRVKVRKGQCI